MYDGKKSTAFDIFYSSLEVVKNKLPNEEKAPSISGKKPSKILLPLWRLNPAV
jgi:small subunit ribosomal protein S7